MTSHEIVEIITVLITLLNASAIVYFSLKKLKPEVKHLDVEADADLVGAANLNLEGAKISAQMLLDRINELKSELDTERKSRREEQEANERLRRDDLEYFRRRIRDMERESRDYRAWASKLVKQLVDAGHIPVSFVPTIDSDPSVTAVRMDIENKIK